MGVLRFRVRPDSRIKENSPILRAYLTTLEMGVVPASINIHDGLIVCEKCDQDTPKLHLEWDVHGFGRQFLATASLIEREEPYYLPLELARGKLVQVRNQLAGWEAEGVVPSVRFEEVYHAAHRHFSRASSSQADPFPCASEAEQSLMFSFQAAERLVVDRTSHELSVRQQKFQHIPRLIGTTINTKGLSGADEQVFLDAFNSLAISFDWRAIEPVQGEYRWETVDRQLAWCELHRLVPKGGPLLNLGIGGLPDWLGAWDADFRNLLSFASDFVETSLDRYAGRIRFWELVAGGNSGGTPNLREEQRLELVARMLDLARHRDPESQLILRIDQPWGEYQARGLHRLSPFQYADALLRAGLGLGGINLELTAGFLPHAAATRDPLEFRRLLDAWSPLRVPLFLTLACPSSTEEDSKASSEIKIAPSSWKSPWTPQLQQEWIETYLPPLLVDKSISGLFWEHLSDAGPHLFPNGGLMDQTGKPKPAMHRIAHLGKAFR